MSSEDARPFMWPIVGTDADDLRPLLDREWWVFGSSKHAEDPELPVALSLARSSDGRVICTGLIVGLLDSDFVGEGEVTSRALRKIPVAELIGRAMYSDSPAPHHAGARRYFESRMPSADQVRRAPGPKGHPDEHFEYVAEKYREALEKSPKAPVVWLTEQLGVDRSTVARWLRRARDKGFLGESAPGRAGEVPDEEQER